MQHEGGVDVVEHAGLGEEDLAAAALLGRRGDDRHAPGEPLAAPREGQAGAERARGDVVVAAGMPDARQRVVLGENRERGPRLAAVELGQERGGQPADPASDAQATALELVGQPRAGAMLLEQELGVRVDVMARRQDGIAQLVDRGPDACLPSLEIDAHQVFSSSRYQPSAFMTGASVKLNRNAGRVPSLTCSWNVHVGTVNTSLSSQSRRLPPTTEWPEPSMT